jgi:hypothetical protein
LQNIKGKCFSCGSKDHSKADGNHDCKVCHHCKKTGYCSMVCFAKYMGKEKAMSMTQAPADQSQGNSRQSTNSTQQAQLQPQVTTKANATSTVPHPLQKQIEEIKKQIEVLYASF